MSIFSGRKKPPKQSGEEKATGGGESAWAESPVQGQDAAKGQVPAPSPSAPKGIQGAIDKLVALNESNPGFKRLVSEALDAMLEALHITCGAVLVFDPFDQTLVLAAERGLGGAARTRLARVRRNDPASWDMPLHGLLNERAYLIDKPAQSRYVPTLVESGNQSLAGIACLPMLRQRKPVGSLILVTAKGERFGETEIRLAQAWLRQFASIIDDLREREGIAALSETGSAPSAPLQQDGPTKTVKLTPLTPQQPMANAAPSVPAAHATDPSSVLLTEVVAEDLVPGGGPQAPEPHPSPPDTGMLRQQMLSSGAPDAGAAGVARRTAMGEDERRQALAALRSELQAEHAQALAVVQVERDRYAAAVASLTASVEATRAELQARAADAGRVAALESALAVAEHTVEETRHRLTETAKELRSRDLRLEEIEADHQRLAAQADAARRELSGALQRAESAETTLEARRKEIATLGQALSEAQVAADTQRQAARGLEASVAALQAEREATLAALEEAKVHVRNLEAAASSGGGEASALIAERHAAQAKEEATRKAITELTATVTRLEGARAELETRLEKTHAKAEADAKTIAELTSTVERLQDARAELSARLTAKQGKGDLSGQTLSELTAMVGRLEAEKRSLTERSEHLDGQLGQLQEALAAQEQAAREARTEMEAAAAAREQELREALERAAADAKERETGFLREVERLQQEREELAERLSGTERLLRESAAALDAHTAGEEAALAEAARLREAEAAARAVGDEWRQNAEALRERVSALEQAVENATAEIASAGEHATTLQRESEQREEKAQQLANKIVELEQAAQTAAARAEELEASARAAQGEAAGWEAQLGERIAKVAALEEEVESARGECTRWREEAESARTRIMQLSEAVSMVQAESARTANREDAAKGEVARLEAEVERLSARIAGIEAQGGAREVEEAGLRETIRALEGQLTERDQMRADLEATIARLENDRAAAREDVERAVGEAAAADAQIEALRAEGQATAGKLAELAAVLEREGASDAPQPDVAEEPTAEARPPAVARGAVAPEEERFVLLEPGAAIGKSIGQGLGVQARVITPKDRVDTVVREVKDAGATVVGVNLGLRAAANGFQLVRELQGTMPGLRIWAYAASPNATKGIGLGFVEWLPQPVQSDQLVEALVRLGGRKTRALSVGFDMQLLVGVRKRLSEEGISLSMACDSKQGHELCGMVNPQTLVIDLDLPRNDGFRALGRLGGNPGARETWLLCGGETIPVEAGSLVVSGAMERSAASFTLLVDLGKAWRMDCRRGAEPPESEGAGKTQPRGPRPGGSAGRGRETGGRTTPGGRRGTGSPRRSTIM